MEREFINSNKEPSELKISYDHETDIITLEAYDEGFFRWKKILHSGNLRSRCREAL
ncbi:MAG: hypothetical protein PHW89_03175 [Sulfurimonas denitrificans]|nr:hypothetical protein [Sulfurimonas denitrificans]